MKKAFTLIELLVVIAIIAILAAILFPVFTQAKVAAKKTQAISNLKNNGTAVLLYQGSYDDTYPMSAYSNHPTGNLVPGSAVTTAYDAIWPYTKSKEIYLSPGDPKAIPIKAILAGAGLTSAQGLEYLSFGFNFALFEDPSIGTTLGEPVWNETALPSPAETVMFFDATYTGQGQTNKTVAPAGWPATGCADTIAAYKACYITPPFPFSRYNFGGVPRYSDSIVVNFADSHAKAVSKNASLSGDGEYMSQTNVDLGPTKCYNLPFDFNGIPGLIAEPSF